MEEKEKTEVPSGLKAVFERWRKKRLPTAFQELKKIRSLPHYKLVFSSKFQGKLYRINRSWDFFEFMSMSFFKRNESFPGKLGDFGTLRKAFPKNEIVMATGNIGDYREKASRKEYNMVEIFTTKGIGFVPWRILVEVKPDDPEIKPTVEDTSVY